MAQWLRPRSLRLGRVWDAAAHVAEAYPRPQNSKKIKTPLYAQESYRGLASSVRLGISRPTPWESLMAMPNTRPAFELHPHCPRAPGLDGITVEANTLHPEALGRRDGGLSHDMLRGSALTPTAQHCEIPRRWLDTRTPALYHMFSETQFVRLLDTLKNIPWQPQYSSRPTNAYPVLFNVYLGMYTIPLNPSPTHGLDQNNQSSNPISPGKASSGLPS